MSGTTDENFLRPLEDQFKVAGMKGHAHAEHDDPQEEDRMRYGP